MSSSQNILLVHGMAHDASCWKHLVPELEEKGDFQVHTLTLSGHGDNPKNHFLVSMNSYAEDVCNKARSIGAPVILVGHSMGGVVISMAAEKDPTLFSQLIYLTAITPNSSGSSLISAARKQPKTEASELGDISFFRGSVFFPPEDCIPIFYNKCSPEIQSEAAKQLCPQPIRPFFSKLKWSEKKLGAMKKSYIECTDDRAIAIELQREYQGNLSISNVASLPADHSPFLSMPERLAETIASLIC